MLPIGNPHPVITNSQTVRASAALAGAGAWDATPTEFACAGHRHMMLYLAYTRGAAGGAFDFKIEVSPRSADVVGVEDWFQSALLANGAVVGGADSQAKIQRQYITYGSTAAGAENFAYGPVALDSIERIRVAARESGVVGTPGTLHIVGVFWE